MRSVFNDVYAILFLIFFIKACVVWYSFELPRLVEAIQMSTNNIMLCCLSTNNICFYKINKNSQVLI